MDGEAGSPVTVVSFRPRTAAVGGRPQAGLEGVEKVFTATSTARQAEREAGMLLSPSVPPRHIVLVLDVARDRYSPLLLVARTGVAVAHRRLGLSSSATTSTCA